MSVPLAQVPIISQRTIILQTNPKNKSSRGNDNPKTKSSIEKDNRKISSSQEKDNRKSNGSRKKDNHKKNKVVTAGERFVFKEFKLFAF